VFLLFGIVVADELAITIGWYEGRHSYYYDFATNTPVVDDVVQVNKAYYLVYGFDTNNNPEYVPGQYPIFLYGLNQTGYSDLFEVIFLTVPQIYVANSVKDSTTALSNWAPGIAADYYLNLPNALYGTTLQDGNVTNNAWVNGNPAYYFSFGENPTFTIRLYHFPTVDGQDNIINAIPSDSGYSAFWEIMLVTPAAGYVANTFKSFDDVSAAGLTPVSTGTYRNCPVVRTDPIPMTTAVIITPAGSDASSVMISLLLLIAMCLIA